MGMLRPITRGRFKCGGATTVSRVAFRSRCIDKKQMGIACHACGSFLSGLVSVLGGQLPFANCGHQVFLSERMTFNERMLESVLCGARYIGVAQALRQ